ncbi:PAS domain-containing protein [Pontibacter litorisediminis]|uniref:PAS domain-containing protein n=1 Tax=Pontibacter litorisediminis TaxID=1846260 RepID=UPI0023EC4193|nr:PAS domain-containing protein [Pontibacter litorisediminis]
MMDFVKVFENVPEALVVVSPAYKILAATDRYLQITMRRREDIVGLHFLQEAFPDKELPYEENPVRKSLDRAVSAKQVDYLDVIRYDLTKPDGTYEERYWEASHTPVLDSEGNVEYIIQRTSDVTEREKAKRALHESNEKFRFMAEAMPQLVFTTDDKSQVTYFNKRWEEYTGVTLEQLHQASWHEIIHPDDLKVTQEKWERAILNGEAMQVELRKRDKDGEYRWHLCRANPMKDAEGHITMWVGSSTDIHDTRKLVQELLESNEQMAQLSDQVQHAYEKAESERKTLETLIMEAPAMFVLLKGPEHRFELLNDKYQQLYPGRNLIGLPLAEALPEIEEQGFINLLDNVYNTGETYVAEGVPILLPQKGTRPLEERFFNFSYQPVYVAGKVTGILAFGYDTTNEVLFKRKMENLGQVG